MKRKLFRVAGATFGLFTLSFFIVTLWRYWEDLSLANLAPDIFWLQALVLVTLAPLISGFLWHLLVVRLTGFTPRVRDSLRAHLIAWIMRYVPSVGYAAYKTLWLTSAGLRFRVVSFPILFEATLTQASSLLVGVALLLPIIDLGVSPANLPVLGSALVLAAIVVGAALVFWWPRFSKFSASEREKISLPLFQLSQIGLLSLAPRVLNGLGVVAIAWSLGHNSVTQLLATAGVFILASALGVLVPFVPSGLGVREGVLVLLLPLFAIDTLGAVEISLALRAVTTASDLVIAGGALSLRKETTERD